MVVVVSGLRYLVVAKVECSERGSNSRPPDYETDALPTELSERAVVDVCSGLIKNYIHSK